MQMMFNKMIKKNLAVFQVLLLVIGIFAFAYAFNGIGMVNAAPTPQLPRLTTPPLPTSASSELIEFFEKPLVNSILWTAVAFVAGGIYGTIVSGEVGEEALYWGGVGAQVVGAYFGAEMAATWLIELIPALAVPGLREAIVIITVLVTVYATTRRENQRNVLFSCKAWQPEDGGDNCNLCNEYEFGCTDYQCASLGKSCRIINAGEPEEACENDYDSSPIEISAWDEYLPDGYAYEELSSGLGVEIKYTADGEEEAGCVPYGAQFMLGVELNKFAACRIEADRTENYESMNSLDSEMEAGLYKKQLKHPVVIPPSEEGGEMERYVRCIDTNGVATDGEFVFKFCVEDGPDNTAPVIYGFNLADNTPIKYFEDDEEHEKDIIAYVDDLATCKWSETDKNYDVMENTMDCDTSETSVNAQLAYTCSGTLTGLNNRENNEFFFRCKNNNDKVMSESKKLTLIGTQPLVIDWVKPDGETISDNSQVVSVPLEAKTSAGFDSGIAKCYYSDTGNYDDYFDFDNTESYEHSHNLPLAEETYTYYIRCFDMAGNPATKTVTFEVETDVEAPSVVRVYHEGGDLKLMTSEAASCVYYDKSCNYNFDNGVTMTSDAEGIIHSTAWDTDNNFYVKCKDEYGNHPSGCNIIVRPFEFF